MSNIESNKRISLTEDNLHDHIIELDVGCVAIKWEPLFKQILDDHKIVDGLLHFIKHCDKMIESYELQLKDSVDDDKEQFLESVLDEWLRKKSDLTELIEFTTTNNSEDKS